MRPQFFGKPIKTNKDYGKACIKLKVLGLPRIDGRGCNIGARRAGRVAELLSMVDTFYLAESGGSGVRLGCNKSGQRCVRGMGA